MVMAPMMACYEQVLPTPKKVLLIELLLTVGIRHGRLEA